jgi:hypothetical protein
VAALLLTRLKKDAAAEWPRPVATTTKEPVAGGASASTSATTSASSPFVSPAMLSLVEGQIARALDASKGGSGGSVGWSGANAAWLQDPRGAADVIGAALNVMRFVFMRERSGKVLTAGAVNDDVSRDWHICDAPRLIELWAPAARSDTCTLSLCSC